MVRGKDFWFLILCIINLLVVVVYLVMGLYFWPKLDRKKKKDTQKRNSVILKALVMFFCPLIGPLYFVVGNILFHICFRAQVDLEDVIFSKERVKTNERVDEEKIMNMVPLEEAIAVSDKGSLRNLMMNVIKGDIRDSLASIALALNSEDTETSHYAASVLRDELNAFRMQVYKLSDQVKKWEDNPQDTGLVLLEYMNCVLEQKVFADTEQRVFTSIMDEVGTVLYQREPECMETKYLEWLCLRLVQIRDYDKAQKWCEHLSEQYPKELAAYTCRLKLYFAMGEKNQFYKVMEELKKSEVAIDSETLGLIRTFM